MAGAAGAKTFAQAAPAGERLFAGEPTAAAGDGHRISFKLAKPVDATVRILDEECRIVRRLASGMVGLGKAIAGFQPGSLSQQIVWDGKDDAGREVPKGRYVVELGGTAEGPAQCFAYNRE